MPFVVGSVRSMILMASEKTTQPCALCINNPPTEVSVTRKNVALTHKKQVELGVSAFVVASNLWMVGPAIH